MLAKEVVIDVVRWDTKTMEDVSGDREPYCVVCGDGVMAFDGLGKVEDGLWIVDEG